MTAAGEDISVRLFAGLELAARERRAQYRFSAAELATVADLMDALGLQPGVAGLVLVNGLHASVRQKLAPGDEVSLFPPLGGG